jgi:redox-sensitive bicupin YhaK (pirin superfamily)
MTHPQYRDIQAKQVPVINHDNATIRIISGYFNQMAGAIQPDYVPLTFLDVAIKPASTIMIPTKKEDTVFAYIMTGKAVFEEKGLLLDPKQAVLFHEGEELMIKTNESDVRFFLFMAPKLSEPVAWGGPIVMNTEEELRLAFQELRNNTFIKTK